MKNIRINIIALSALCVPTLSFAQEFQISAPQPSASCCTFPLENHPTESYLTGARQFGAGRSSGRKHAACDLYTSSGGEIVKAVGSGTVVRGPYAFYQGTYAIEVKHDEGFVIRYGEVTGKVVSGIKPGARVNEGATIGYVGKVNSNCCPPMLHFELFSGKSKGALTQRSRKPYQRRSDLLNPTTRLQTWEASSLGSGASQLDTHISNLFFSPSHLTHHELESQLRNFSPANLEQEVLAFLLKSSVDYGVDPTVTSKLAAWQMKAESTFHTTAVSGSEIAITAEAESEVSSLRHFHAQYFDENDSSESKASGNSSRLFAQHVSIEFADKPGHFEFLKESVGEVVGGLGRPEIENSDFVQWRLPEGYVIWMKVLNAQDLADNPISEHSSADLGSVRVAVELAPHY